MDELPLMSIPELSMNPAGGLWGRGEKRRRLLAAREAKEEGEEEDTGGREGVGCICVPLSPSSPIEKRRAGLGTPVLRLMLNLRLLKPGMSGMVAVG